MSTAIFQSNGPDALSPNPYAHLTPLQTYLVLTLPLTATTLAVWLIFNRREKSLADKDKRKYYNP